MDLLKSLIDRKIVTNTDIDGILSAAFLLKYKGGNVCGFTNSKDKIWLEDCVTKNNALYLDIFLTNKDIITIDNHIVSTKTSEFPETKINPNLLRGISKKRYTNKYPFSTCIFIIKMLEDEIGSINIDLDTEIKNSDGESVFLWEILLRADDTLLTTHKYKNNATEWWSWVNNGKDDRYLTVKLFSKTKEFNLESAKAEKSKINSFIKKTYSSETDDGFRDVFNVGFKKFVEEISGLIHETVINNEIYQTYTLSSNVIEASDEEIDKIIQDPKTKSYAIISNKLISYSQYE